MYCLHHQDERKSQIIIKQQSCLFYFPESTVTSIIHRHYHPQNHKIVFLVDIVSAAAMTQLPG
jgi:hypothetical protein